jgi:hypothetical protein
MHVNKLLLQDSVLLSQPLLIEQFGRAGAQFLNQLHYWIQHRSDVGKMDHGIRWIYNSANKWAEQLRIGPRQIQRIVKKLNALGIIQVQKLCENKYNRTNHYTIDYDSLQKHLEDKNHLKPAENPITTFCRNASRQDVAMYIQKLHNKDINKSEALPIKQVGQGETESKRVELVKRVKNIISKNEEKKADSSDQAYLNEISTKTRLTGKTSTAQDMLAIWNETLSEKAKASMSKDLAPLLVSAYSKKFEQNLDQWKRYCELIKSSTYLMGEQFQLSIFWGLKFSTIDRVRAGELGVKLNYIDSRDGYGSSNKSIVNESKVQEMIEALDESIEAKTTRLKIAQAVGAAAYHSWFHQAAFVSRDGEIQLVAPNPFVEQHWESQFSWVNKGNASC